MNRRLLALVLCVVLVLAIGDDAWARVGGGESFGTGGGSGGGFGGGSSGGGEGDILVLLIWLAIEYPAIGCPLLALFVGFLVLRWWMSRNSGPTRVSRTHGSQQWAPDPLAAAQQRADEGPISLDSGGSLAGLREVDEGFSEPVLYDFVQLIHRRATEAAPTRAWDPLAPFVAPSARSQLEHGHQGIERVSQVVLGGMSIQAVHLGRDTQRLRLRLQGTRLERLITGNEVRVYLEESWTFERRAGVTSLAPEAVQRLGCPSCGAAIETDPMGRCTTCETPITEGQLQWRVTDAALGSRREIEPPRVSLGNGGKEPSWEFPTRADPHLGVEYRAFKARHPDFDREAFEHRVQEVFLKLQAAWSDGEWERARPFTTDPMFQSLRFWMDQYAANGMKNRVQDVEVLKRAIVKVQMDAWYEAVTVRVWARARDWIEDRDGDLVGGNSRTPRFFSEYWTFLRAVGTGADSKDVHHCPSCSAPLDDVNAAGVCGYCGSKITTGRFDWVLSRIDQPAVYRG